MRHFSKGFTLLEIVVIIILLSILGAVAIPRLVVQDYDNVFFVDAFVGAMRHAQKTAVATQIDVAVIWEPDDRNILFLFRDQTNAFAHPVTSPYSTRKHDEFILELPEETTFTPPPYSIYFDPGGRARNVLTHQIPHSDLLYKVNDHIVRLVGETGFVYEDI